MVVHTTANPRAWVVANRRRVRLRPVWAVEQDLVSQPNPNSQDQLLPTYRRTS